MYLITSTRCGISAKQLERELGVTYKTAWRMFNKIRSLLPQDGDEPFGGIVEMDDAYIGGRDFWRHNSKKTGKTGRPGVDDPYRTPVFGIAQRGASGHKGKVMAKVVASAGERAVIGHIKTKVLPASTVYTDEYHAYKSLGQMGMGYRHSRVHHSQKEDVAGDVHTNTREGLWALGKRGISGVYRGVSPQQL